MMNDLIFMNDVMNGLLGSGSCARYSQSLPSVDVRERKDAYVLDMDLPGLDEKDVELTLEKGNLTIASVKKEQAENKAAEKPEYLIRERKNLNFSRRFALPENVDTENVSAAFKNGVLTVTLPKKAEEKARKINISTAA